MSRYQHPSSPAHLARWAAIPRPRIAALAGAAALFVWLAFGGPAAAGAPASSASFVLQQSTVNSGGGASASASYRLDGSAAQASAAGTSNSPSYLMRSGFWTDISTRVVLRVEGAGSGAGSVIGGVVSCQLDAGSAAGTCAASLIRGAAALLVATPDASQRFDGWTGCDSLSTTALPGDTCGLVVRSGRSVSAAFTALATVGDRVWRDIDGNGVQNAGEPGLPGIAVFIDDGDGVSGTVVTAGDGSYAFLDVPPGTYTLEVDPQTLPAGVRPSFDPDGVATPNRATLSPTDGQSLDDADFGYQPLTNLAVELSDSEDPLPGGEDLTYSLTVANLGPGIATSVTLRPSLPAGTRLVATAGCAEDPFGAPNCSLGDLDVGESVDLSIEVSVDPAPPASITFTADVFSIEVDLDLFDNAASDTTGLDADPPSVTLVSSTPSTSDGALTECENVHGTALTALTVGFDEPMLDPPGDATPGDVTSPETWSLVEAGPDGELSTVACGAAAGDDVPVPLGSVLYESLSAVATLRPEGGSFGEGLYTLLVCGAGANAATDLAGNAVDGDGDGAPGDDFARQFRLEPENLLANGSLDCDLGSWSLSSDDPDEVVYSPDDLDGSADSGSAALARLSNGARFALDQCVELEGGGGTPLQFAGAFRLETEAPSINMGLGCEFFDGPGCRGQSLLLTVGSAALGDTDSSWLELFHTMTAPESAQSTRCSAAVSNLAGDAFEARIDRLRLTDSGALFEDGFESGDTAAWSETFP
ncbi:MAG: SdrD B-like domain-containing protein [Acidobacteriota bacterium]